MVLCFQLKLFWKDAIIFILLNEKRDTLKFYKNHTRVFYLISTMVLILLEVLIALYSTGYIRYYFGDILVVSVVYCLVRVIVPKRFKLMPVYILAFSVLVEFFQYIHIVDILNITNNILRTIVGTTFSWWDILCYTMGTIPISIWEYYIRKKLD